MKQFTQKHIEEWLEEFVEEMPLTCANAEKFNIMCKAMKNLGHMGREFTEEDAKAWYDKEYNANYLDRADARASLAATRDILADRYKAAEGSAAVTGATDESLARQKAAANEVLADVTSNLAQSAEAHKEAVRANYENQQEAYRKEKVGVNNQKANATVQAAQGLAQSAQSLGDAADEVFGGKIASFLQKKGLGG